jgi:hypothetical protein
VRPSLDLWRWLPLRGEKLAIYLNDHLAGSTAALELSRRIAASNARNAYAAELRELAGEVEQDRALLLDVMTRLSVSRDHLKVGASWLAEKAGRVKLNGELLRYSPLSRLEELEALSLGIHGKLGLWEALRLTHGSDPRLDGIDLGGAIARARAQTRRLDRLRRSAAREALSA